MPSKGNTKRPHGTGSVRPKRRGWEGRFSFNGKQIPVSLGTREDVDSVRGISEAEAFRKLQKVIANYEPPKEDSKITFGALCDKFYIHKQSLDLGANSLANIESNIRVHLKPQWEDRDAASITAEEMQRFQAKLRRQLADKTVRNIMSTLFSVCDYGVKKAKVLLANECVEVEKLKARSTKTDMIVLSTAELDEIRAAFPDTPLGRQDALMVLAAARSGLRQGELISVRWRNVDFDGGKIRVATSFERVTRSHKEPKSYEPRALPLAEIVHDPLYEHFKQSRWNKPDDLVFPHPETGRELDGAALNDRFKQAVIAANIRPHEYEMRQRKTSSGKYKPWTHTPITWHDLRHAFGTFLAANGFASATIEAWCGWADKKTMQRYLHYRPGGTELEMLNAAIRRDQERNALDRPFPVAASIGTQEAADSEV
ncbi:MAG: site-specific integrase [Actinobacteria bacterium]|nr:site-specific integrase [Actinomycetota bacterium]